jgi:hypothetical protein
MRERRLEIDRVAMTAPVSPYVQHPSAPQVTEKAPDRPMRQGHCLGDLIGSAIRMRGYVKDDGAMTGNKIKASNVAPLFGSFRKAFKE